MTLPAPPSTILRAWLVTFAVLGIVVPLTWMVVDAMTGGAR